jgi:yeast amino acid transporter
MRVQGHNIDDLPFKAVFGVWGSWLGLILNILCVIAQFFIAVSPVKGAATAYDFFVQMLALPVIIVCFVGWKLWNKTKWVKASEVDLLSGRREMDLAAAKQEEREEREIWRWWKKYYSLELRN